MSNSVSRIPQLPGLSMLKKEMGSVRDYCLEDAIAKQPKILWDSNNNSNNNNSVA